MSWTFGDKSNCLRTGTPAPAAAVPVLGLSKQIKLCTSPETRCKNGPSSWLRFLYTPTGAEVTE